jgi:hypothetical protein
MVLALNTVSGQVSDVPPKMLVHPHFGKYLVPVEEGTKSYNPEMYTGGTVEEKAEQRPNKSFFGFTKKDNSEDNIDIEDEN